MFLGYVIADGSYTKGQSIKFTNRFKKYLDEVTEIVGRLFPGQIECKRYSKGPNDGADIIFSSGTHATGKNPLRNLFRDLGILDQMGPGKRLPKVLFQAKKEEIALFLNRLWSADGWVASKGEHPEIAMGVQSEEFAREVQFLLHKFGVGSRIELSSVKTCGKKALLPFWKIRIARSVDILRFFDAVGMIYGKERQSIRAYETANRFKKQAYTVQNEVSWDNIIRIEPMLPVEMFDLQTRKNHNFVCDGYVVHNSGKTETVVVTLAGCIVMFPILAKYIKDKRIAKFKQGLKVGIFAPAHEQADTMSQRLIDRLRSAHAKEVLMDDEINIDMDDRYTRTLELPNGSVVRTHSAAKQAKIESKTYDVLILEEAQAIDPFVYKKSISPMGASTAATQIKIGTPNMVRSDFYDTCQRNQKKDAQNPKDKLHFQYDWEVAAKYNPRYKKYVKAEFERFGFDSDEVRMAYRLHWILERGMLVDATLLESLGGNYWITPFDHKNDVVVGIDIGKITASTVVTVVKPDYENGTQMAPDDYRSKKRIYNWLELSGDKYDEQTFQITQFLANYKNIKRIHIDATGVGQHMFDNLTTYYQQQIDQQEMEVIGFIASPTSNSEGYTRLLLDIQNLRLEFPNSEKAKKSETQRRFVAQMTNVRKNFRGALLSVQESEELPMKDYVSSLMLACWGCDISGEMPELDADDRNILFGGTIFGRGHKNELFSGPRERNPLIH
jgi:hypothetical protein